MEIGDSAVRWVECDASNALTIENCAIHQIIQVQWDKYAFSFSDSGKSYVALTEDLGASPFSLNGVLGSARGCVGLMTVLLSLDEICVKDHANVGYELAEEIFGTTGSYSLELITKFFRSFEFWEVDPGLLDPALSSTAYRIYGARLASTPKIISLNFDNTVLAKIALIFESNAGRFVSEPAFRALTAVHWEHAFLELYRCLERLYAVPYVENLRQALAHHSHNSVCAALDDNLGWTPREEPALRNLFSLCDQNIINSIYKLLSPAGSQISQDLNGSAAKMVYRIRNGIAHFRWTPSDTNKLPWNDLIGYICDAILNLYTKYTPVLDT